VIIRAEEKIEKKADLKTIGVHSGLMLLYAFFLKSSGYAISTFLMFIAGYALLWTGVIQVRDGVIAVDIQFCSVYIFLPFCCGSASPRVC